MLSTLLLVARFAAMMLAATYVGRENQLHVRIPRLAGEVTVNGVLDEPAWQQADVLTGFSEFSPRDGIPAADSTRVLVWYSPTAIYFGIRAFEPHGAVHATQADRDKIASDDNVQILLGTFHDHRQAYVFGVNPFGVQMDGTIVEQGQILTGAWTPTLSGRASPNLSQDFVFSSKGRLTDYGYEVEVRIPLKSLKYQSSDEQSWDVNIVRQVQHSGAEDSWAPARRANSSFLAQSGTLDGLTGLTRGLVLDVNPSVTERVTGGPSPRGWGYDRAAPQVGGRVQWGITNTLTLNGAVNPDFAEVESDAGQFVIDPRQALYFPEKRPFFLEGLDAFNTPHRRPVAVRRRLHRSSARRRLQSSGGCGRTRGVRRGLQRFIPGGGQLRQDGRGSAQCAALGRNIRPQRQAVRPALCSDRHQRRFSSGKRLHLASGNRARRHRSPCYVVRRARIEGRDADGRRPARRPVAVLPFRATR